MPTPLSLFLAEQLDRLGLKPDEFAKSAGLVRSHVYFILSGERQNVGVETLDKIAAALHMTPAEMAVAMGRGAPEADPGEVQVLSTFRRIPPAKRDAALDMLNGLAVQPTQRPTRRRADEGARRRERKIRELDEQPRRRVHEGDEDLLAPLYRIAWQLPNWVRRLNLAPTA